jgi:hypothetical protein
MRIDETLGNNEAETLFDIVHDVAEKLAAGVCTDGPSAAVDFLMKYGGYVDEESILEDIAARLDRRESQEGVLFKPEKFPCDVCGAYEMVAAEDDVSFTHERYHCRACGNHMLLDYEEMK